MNCPSCGEEAPGRARFCLACGTSLTPAEAAEKVRERKVVTVLFCDLVGFTSASEFADPEDVEQRLATYHSMLRTEIERYGGTVEKFIGDAVMAVFGAPRTHEDDPERAVRAGLRIVDATAELNESQAGLDLRVRVGINTGEAVVDLSARPERGEGFVTGDVVNTASRLQGAAPVGGVAVGEQTHEATKAVFDYVELPHAEVEGKSRPVALFHARTALARFGTDLTRQHNTPLVGREIDLALLKGAFDKALAGPSLQLVTIVGEPGVGKSRLVTELFQHVDSLPDLVRFRQGHCLPYGDGITFWAIGEIVKAEAGMLDSDDRPTAAGKLQNMVARLIADAAEHPWFTDRLAPVVGLRAASSGTQEEMFAAWRRLLEAAAIESPTVCVVEDLHWADDALLRFIEHLAEWCQGVPLLVVCTARPELYEKHRTWGAGLRNAHQISLDPLSEAEAARLVAVLSRTALAPETQGLVVERSGGNPLYAEEFVRMLADQRLVDDSGKLTSPPSDLSFPASVQAIIAARLDTLPADRKAALQDAAVIGKVFWAGAVATLTGRPERAMVQDLHELSKKELLRPSRTSTVAGQMEYSFWHAYVRDVAYSTIPRAARATKHQSAAEWIERMAGARVEEYAEILAHHYLTALELATATGTGDPDRLRDQARRHLLSAGIRAIEVDVSAAEGLLRAALDITSRDHRQRPDIELHLGRTARDLGRTDDARNMRESAIAGFERQGRTAQAARARIGLAEIVDLYDPLHAERIISDAVAILERLPPGSELIVALERAARRSMLASRLPEAVALAERTLQLLDDGTPTEGPPEPTRARALFIAGFCRFNLGDAEALREMRAAVALNPQEPVMHNNLAMVLRVTEGPAAALTEVRKAINLATAMGRASAALGMHEFLFDLNFAIGRWDDTLEQAPAVIERLQAIGDDYNEILVEVWSARILLTRGVENPSRLIESFLPRARHLGDPQVRLSAVAVAGVGGAQLDDAAARALLAEAAQLWAGAGEVLLPLYLPQLVRLAVSNTDMAAARRLIEQTPPNYPASRASLASARAAVAEAEGHPQEAVSHYREASDRWTDLGDVVERAHALLGLGRTRLAVGDRASASDVQAAREIWGDLGAYRLKAEADQILTLLRQTTS